MGQWITVNPKQLSQLLGIDFKLWTESGGKYGRAPLVRGHPGIGKTEIIEQFYY